MSTVLIVDDEPGVRRLLGMVLTEDGHFVVEASSVAEARGVLAQVDVNLVVTDQKLGDGEGLSVLAAARDQAPTVPVILLTAYATVPLAVSAMRAGAFDVVAKPFDAEGVKAAARRALEHARLARENQLLRVQVSRATAPQTLVGDSPAMVHLKEIIARVAPTSATVLITGETGVGKELVARALHAQSPRARGAFLAVNCAAVPEGLLESELFGHEKGAFTGADRATPGMFEAAHGGTLFLDEVGEMPISAQAKLLRVLTDRLILRVGSRVPRMVDVRLLVATHRDLSASVAEGSFREDLYFRLAVVPIHVPPLRERKEDIPALVTHLLERASGLSNRVTKVSPAAMERLLGYAFPGNVRELRNLVERASILAADSVIEADDLLLPVSKDSRDTALSLWSSRLPEQIDLDEVLSRVEEALVARAMESAGGVQAEAARRLGLARSVLHYRLERNR